MEGEASPAHPSLEGGKISVRLLWALPYDMNAHVARQTKGATGGNEHESGTSTIDNSGMEDPRGEEEPGGEGPRGPQVGDTSGETGTRGPNTEFIKRETSQSLSHNNSDTKYIAHMPMHSFGHQVSHTTVETSNKHIYNEAPCPSPQTGCKMLPANKRRLLDTADSIEPPQEAHSPGHPLTPQEAVPSPISHGVRDTSFLFPAASSTAWVTADEDFPLVLVPFSVLGLNDNAVEDEALGSGPPSPGDVFGEITADHLLSLGVGRRGVNMTEGVPVPTSEHVAEIVGRQGCKIKALRAKTNTYIKTPVRGEESIFIVTGRKEDVEMAKCEILSAAEHFSVIRATRNKMNGIPGSTRAPPNLPGQTTIQVRVPYRVVGLVVGPKGVTIKQIQQTTHTYIVTPSRDKEPVFEVTGMPENVDRAREEIEAHITIRTGSLVDIQPDTDFHSNGKVVCMDLLGGGIGNLGSKVPASHRGSSGTRNETLRSSSLESPYHSIEGREQCAGSPFRSVLCGNLPLGGETNTGPPLVGIEYCEFGLEHLALDVNTPATIWSPFETANGHLQNFSECPAHRRNSGFHGCATPLLSPTLPDNGIGLDHPLACRIHSDLVSSFSWMPNQGSFSYNGGYSSSSSLPTRSSVASGSPTDSSSSEGQRKSGRDCVVCYENEVTAALVPCGHNLFCMECAIRICGSALPECPACHSPATQAIRIFS
ncbi:RNA-binding protein MEX3D [Rhinoderma darwinii]|uniref:RNA-binding protein MEX3D n=1 Tax=Rhinoderma darwinii TaxID=43563 RepID=UPI003F671FE8